MRTPLLSTDEAVAKAVAKYEALVAQGFTHAEAVEHAAIYFGVASNRLNDLIQSR